MPFSCHFFILGSSAKQCPQPNQNNSVTSILSPVDTVISLATDWYLGLALDCVLAAVTSSFFDETVSLVTSLLSLVDAVSSLTTSFLFSVDAVDSLATDCCVGSSTDCEAVSYTHLTLPTTPYV